MQLNWYQPAHEMWFDLHALNLGHSHFDSMEGVYIIWQGNGPVVRVGQGIVRDRLMAHRNDPAISKYSPLYVTWASVPSNVRGGVERYLANTLRPVVGTAFPATTPTPVLLPWSWSL